MSRPTHGTRPSEAISLASVFKELPAEVVSLILREIDDANKLFVALESTEVFTSSSLSFVRLVSDMPIGSCSRLAALENRARALTPNDLLTALSTEKLSKNVLYLCELSPEMSMDKAAMVKFLNAMEVSSFYLVVHFDAPDKTSSTLGFDTLLSSTMNSAARSVILDVNSTFETAVLIDKLPSTITDKVIITGDMPFLDVANHKGTTKGKLRFEDIKVQELVMIGSYQTIGACWNIVETVDYLFMKSNSTTGVTFGNTTFQNFVIDLEILNGQTDTSSFKKATFRKNWSAMEIQMANGDNLVFQEPKNRASILKLELFTRPTLNADKTHFSIRHSHLTNTTIKAPRVKITSLLLFPCIRNTKCTADDPELIFETKSVKDLDFYNDKMTNDDLIFFGQFSSIILINLDAARILNIRGTRHWKNITKLSIDLCISKTSESFTQFFMDDTIEDFSLLKELKVLFPKTWQPCIPGWKLPKLNFLCIGGNSPFVNASELMMICSTKLVALEELEIGLNVTSTLYLDKRHDEAAFDKSMIGTPLSGLKKLKLSFVEGNLLALFSFPDLIQVIIETVSVSTYKGIMKIDAPHLEKVRIVYTTWVDKGPLPRLVFKSPNKVKEIITQGVTKVIVVPKTNTPDVVSYGDFRGYKKPVTGTLTDLGNGVLSQRFELGSLRIAETQNEVINQLVQILLPGTNEAFANLIAARVADEDGDALDVPANGDQIQQDEVEVDNFNDDVD